jgi:indole-3-glycerol phosphate synthase
MGFLEEIVRETRLALHDPAYGSGVPERSYGAPPSLRAAVERDSGRGALIVEYKRVSPGQSEPRLPVRSVAEFVRAVEPVEVSGYSCLAARPRFEGAPADVAELCRATARPVLFKEFVVDPVQLDLAVRAGASAVLLIARLETQRLLAVSLRRLAEEAHDRGLEVLLEWHARSELSGTDGVPADMYGVNVRDLDTLSLDRATAEATLEAAAATGYRPLLGLSGVESPADARRFWSRGADGLLVGSAVARSPDPRSFLASLRRPVPGGAA